MNKLSETNKVVAVLEVAANELEPVLAVKSAETEELMEKVQQEQEKADKVICTNTINNLTTVSIISSCILPWN